MNTPTENSAHTPGPWHWQYNPMTNLPVALANARRDVLLSTGDDSSAWAQVLEADMRLIASAPELLSSAISTREVLRQIVSLANVNDATREMLVHVGNKLNEIVTKATGGVARPDACAATPSDTERLDALLTLNVNVWPSDRGTFLLVDFTNFPPKTTEHATGREAIDAAMAKKAGRA